MVNLDDIEAKARAANPGPWVPDKDVAHWVLSADGSMNIHVSGPQDQDNADYILAMQPSVALELVAELRAARAVSRFNLVECPSCKARYANSGPIVVPPGRSMHESMLCPQCWDGR